MRARRKLGLGLLTAALLLLSIEGVLRLAGDPPEPTLVVTMPDGNRAPFTESDGTLVPNYQGPFPVAPIPLEKSGPRVLMFGGSSVHGGGTERLRLDQEMPGVLAELLGVEVRNLGGPGLDTGHLVGIVEAAGVLQPDVIVLYTGHNDLGNAVFFHRYGDLRSVLTHKARGTLGNLALFQWLEVLLAPNEFPIPTPEAQGLWTVDAERREQVRRHFEERLRRIVRVAKETGAEVVLATVASNPWQPTTEWECPAALRRLGLSGRSPDWDFSGVDQDALSAEDKDCRDIAWLEAVLDADAEILDELRDTDPLPLRADRATVEIIRTVAEDEGVALADVNAALRAEGGGLEPPEHYIDVVHYSVGGHRAVAEVLAPVVDDALAGR
ncbi:MAG TPA: SGNH/GDSL hydrolase family protein [Myxococcota bacterium]|nr:SGNH/GDSL hydrolase family protein [Myxococcota bacterium]